MAEARSESPSLGGSDLCARQIAFTAHLRDPDQCPAPAGIEDRRIGIYRELIFNNLESLLSGYFPVLRRCLSEDHWLGLIRDFLIRHRAHTPRFPELGQELLAFLGGQRANDPRDPPFVLELAHYEWVEFALMIAEDAPDLGGADPYGDLLSGCPLLSPLAWPLVYRYPVHRIDPEHLPAEPPAEPTYLVAYRSRTDRVEFLETNAVTQRLLTLIQEPPGRSGHALLEMIAAELCHPNPAQVIDYGATLLADLHARGVLLGTRRPE